MRYEEVTCPIKQPLQRCDNAVIKLGQDLKSLKFFCFFLVICKLIFMCVYRVFLCCLYKELEFAFVVILFSAVNYLTPTATIA